MKTKKFFSLLLVSYFTYVNNAFAEWEEVASNSTKIVYIDENSIKINGNKSRIWRLINHKKDVVIPGGTKYRSSKVLQEFDCQNSSSRLVYVAAFKDVMGFGDVVSAEYQTIISDPNVPGSI